MSKILSDYLTENSQYKTRLNTDEFFPYISKFSYFGTMDDMADFIQENQLKDKVFWEYFADQFKKGPDTLNQTWKGEYWGKMMRGACITYQYTHDEELYKILHGTALDMLSTQDELGRFSTYDVDGEFTGWDMWSRKYVILGFLHFHEICDDNALKERIIDSLKKHLDYIIEKIGIGENQLPITKTSRNHGGMNSSSILEPVMRLYNATGEERYLDFAKYIVAEGGSALGNIFELAYEDKIKPYQYPVTKAYEMMSCFEGLLEYYRATGIEKWKTAVINFVNALIDTDITIIGCAACLHEYLNNADKTQTLTTYKGAMQETCVTVTWMKLCMQLLCLTGDVRYAEQIEKSIYNALYGSVNTQKAHKNGGLLFDSYSPLLRRFRGMGIGGLQVLNNDRFYGCCAAIGAAGTGLAPLYTLLLAKDGVVFNSYAKGYVDTVSPSGNPISFEIDTNYPVDDTVEIDVITHKEESFKIRLRIPEFADSATLTVNGEEIPCTPGEYAEIERIWKTDDKISLSLTVTPKIIRAKGHPDDPNSKKHIAIKRGALVLARDKQICDDLGEPFDADKKVSLKKINSVGLDTQCQYLVASDKGNATLMIDYASAGKTLDENSEMECWLPTEKY